MEPQAKQFAEYGKAKVILMHEPKQDEVFPGMLCARAGLFTEYFFLGYAKTEHKKYRKALTYLKKEDTINIENDTKEVEVFTIKDVLLMDILEKDNSGEYIPIDEEELNKLNEASESPSHELYQLRDFIKTNDFLTYYTTPENAKELNNIKEKLIDNAHPKDLVSIILQNRELTIAKDTTGAGDFEEKGGYKQYPMMNLYFTRDQMITTANGFVIGKMNTTQREDECKIIKFCLEKLIRLNKLENRRIYEITDKGRLEGGDFIPFGDIAFIGCGQRTNMEAIHQLMENDLLGVNTLVVVKDNLKDPDQMHLDTHFNILNKDYVTMSKDRYCAQPNEKFKGENANKGEAYLTVDVYEKKGDNYEKTKTDQPFTEYLKSIPLNIIPINRYANTNDKKHKFADEVGKKKRIENFACNYLNVGSNKIMAVEQKNKTFYNNIKAKGIDVIDVIEVEMKNLIKGNGGPHCTTQVLVRE